ncbi:hypothetical protein J6590_105751 [Homalodisca vitripennis]|nr:hypothetical protein J6590_105751 [Homalodisca vitripennis]
MKMPTKIAVPTAIATKAYAYRLSIVSETVVKGRFFLVEGEEAEKIASTTHHTRFVRKQNADRNAYHGTPNFRTFICIS